jgi:hypothetical protein
MVLHSNTSAIVSLALECTLYGNSCYNISGGQICTDVAQNIRCFCDDAHINLVYAVPVSHWGVLSGRPVGKTDYMPVQFQN